ncbi:MAG: tRNA pseudouridine synthase A [Ilumatobacteraceae bacterium]
MAPVAPAPQRRARLLVAYDGTGFHGFAESRGRSTVMGTLRAAIERVVQHPTELVGAGRTDAGVHGWGQVVSLDLPAGSDLDRLACTGSHACAARRSSCAAADWCDDPEFSARFSARYRHYRYDVLTGAVPVPWRATTTWHVRTPLDLRSMQLGCDPLIGEHDFSSFCRMPKVRDGEATPSMRRRVLLARWTEVDTDDARLLRFEIRANAFCHQMVRSIVGTLVDVGSGKLHAGEVRGILLAHDRAAAGQVAPPQGLTLWEVGY